MRTRIHSILITLCLLLLLAQSAFAVGTVVFASVEKYPANNPTMIIISYTCTSDASAGTLPAKDILVSEVGFNYWQQGFYLLNAKAVNPAANYPTGAQTLSLTDSDGAQLIGSTAGDTLTLSTSASVSAVLSSSRSPAQRGVEKLLTIGAVASSIGNSKVFTYRLILGK